MLVKPFVPMSTTSLMGSATWQYAKLSGRGSIVSWHSRSAIGFYFPFTNYMNSSATSRKLQFSNSSSRVDMKLFLILLLLAIAAAAPSSSKTEEKDIKTAEVTIVSQSDVRHVNGTNEWK
ncbi:hypothetical protein OUZ56_001070 [Daphnia magna]|uniref:Uncharacterized protein n=1 Tax=Daphnia magna TaxID=35525 RepID=A0ABR0A1K1_9CRUS|nr:hypothetical protein OUZ56_001070 [Daphnia magna]